MDISKIDTEIAQDEQGVDVPMFLRDGEPDLASDGSQTTFIVLGRDSAAVAKVLESQTRQALRRTNRTRLEPKDLYENRVNVALAAVIGWKGVESGGKPVAFSVDACRSVLQHRHILEQVEAGVDSHARFFKSASQS